MISEKAEKLSMTGGQEIFCYCRSRLNINMLIELSYIQNSYRKELKFLLCKVSSPLTAICVTKWSRLSLLVLESESLCSALSLICFRNKIVCLSYPRHFHLYHRKVSNNKSHTYCMKKFRKYFPW